MNGLMKYALNDEDYVIDDLARPIALEASVGKPLSNILTKQCSGFRKDAAHT
jgi:hypothetical protein